MQWREVDLATGWWTIPGDVSKNHDPHRVPLTAPVFEVLRRRRFGADDRYVFSNHRHTCVSASEEGRVHAIEGALVRIPRA